MILWTIQPVNVWRMIQDTGLYRCDPKLCSMPEPEVADKYNWLIRQMAQRIGPPPEGVIYPVWAWYKQKGKHKKPDLRSERWGYVSADEDYTCIEFEIPDEQVLLSDYDSWYIILNNCLFTDSLEEWDQKYAYYDSLPIAEQKAYKEKDWEKVFDITPFKNNWTQRGDWVQATVWELRKDMIRDVRFFRTGKYRKAEKQPVKSMLVAFSATASSPGVPSFLFGITAISII